MTSHGTIRKVSSSWDISVRVGGRQIRKRFKTREAAEAAMRAIHEQHPPLPRDPWRARARASWKQQGVLGDWTDYTARMTAQEGMCAYCGRPPKGQRFDYEHDHATGAIRGLVHRRCNLEIGRVENDWAARGWTASVDMITRLRKYLAGVEHRALAAASVLRSAGSLSSTF